MNAQDIRLQVSTSGPGWVAVVDGRTFQLRPNRGVGGWFLDEVTSGTARLVGMPETLEESRQMIAGLVVKHVVTYEVATVTAEGSILADLYVGHSLPEMSAAHDRARDAILARTPGSRIAGIRVLTQITMASGYRYPPTVTTFPASYYLRVV